MTNYTKIINKEYNEERALYNSNNVYLENIKFISSIGESPLKESNNIELNNCIFSMRYPLWHVNNFKLDNINMDELTRASLWYCDYGRIYNSKLHGIKALRECNHITLENVDIISDEFGWKSHYLDICNCSLRSSYPFLMASDLLIDGLQMEGKYSFQYVQNGTLKNCNFKTKDAFWHTVDVTINDSIIVGEYIGWYSKNLTLINCTIDGTQPFCYCENLKLVNCKLVNCDFAFEKSTVNATITGNVISIKNVLDGEIIVDSCDELIKDDDMYKGNIIIRNK